MKKFIIVLSAFALLTTVSCRQDDLLTSEDNAKLEILKKSQDNQGNIKARGGDNERQGDPIPPPKK